MAYTENSESAVKRQVLGRIGWRLLIVGLAVVAFFALNSLETLKNSYQKDQAAPLVIGDFQDRSASSSKSGPEAGRVVRLDYREIRKNLEDVLFPRATGTPDDLSKLRASLSEKKYSEPLITSLVTSAERMRDRVLASVSRPTTVRDENALIGSFTESIDGATGAEQKLFADARDNRLNAYKKLATKYPDDPKAFVWQFDQLKDKDREANVAEGLEKLKDRSDITVADLMEEARSVEEKNLARINTELNGFAHTNYGRVYSSTLPQNLTDYVNRQRDANLKQNYFSSRILDEQRGEYSLYQAAHVTCIVILVFGLLYPIYLLLRLLPPFAASLDPLADQAKGIISGRTSLSSAGATVAAPGIARTLVLSVAAVGIGTAVAVANNGSTASSKSPSTVADLGPIERELIFNPKIRELLKGATPESTPQPSPAPDDQRLAQLELRLDRLVEDIGRLGVPEVNTNLPQELGRLQQRFEDLHLSAEEMAKLRAARSQIEELNGEIDFKDLKSRTKDIKASDIPLLQNDTAQLKKDVPELNSKLKAFTDRADLVEKTLFSKLEEADKRVETANNQILGARFTDEGSKKDDLLSKAGQLFRRDRYMVTFQSYRVMENLMCEQPVGLSGIMTDKTCTSDGNRAILAKLRIQIGNAPVSESKLLSAINATDSPWKRQLLRYTRLPE